MRYLLIPVYLAVAVLINLHVILAYLVGRVLDKTVGRNEGK